ncbi:hypothetical protein [Streptomyces sp. 900105245]
MPIVPWDQWFYNGSYKQEEIRSLHAEELALQSQVKKSVENFNISRASLQTLSAGNSILIVAANSIQMTDESYKDFLETVDELPEPPDEFSVTTIGSTIAEAAGGSFALKAVWQLGTLTGNLVSGISEDAAEAIGEEAISEAAQILEDVSATGLELTLEDVGPLVAEEVAELAIEDATLATLGETGVGIFLALGLDMICGAIDGARKDAEYDDAITKLQTAVSRSSLFYNQILDKQAQVNIALYKEEERFKELMRALAQAAEPLNANYNLASTVNNASKFQSLIDMAIKQYGPFIKMRNLWFNALSKNANLTEEAFCNNVVFLGLADEDTASRYCGILSNFSDSMRASRKS